MKKVGTFTFSTQNIEKDVWGDVYKGSEDSEVALWGIVKWNVSKGALKLNDGALQNFLADFRRQTGIKIKQKQKSHKYGGKYTQLYIPRPVDKMDDVLEALKKYESDDPIHIEVTEDDFSRIKKAEIAKAI